MDLRLQHIRRYFVGAMTLASFVPASVFAQSLDCAKAATAVEHAICDNSDIAQLDTSLGNELKDLIAARPESRSAVLADERRWLRERDRRCTSDGANQKLHDCLTAEYSSRIEQISQRARGTSRPRTELCQVIADRYRPLAHSHPGENPIGVLVRTPKSGVQLAAAPETVWHPATDLVKWAATQSPPFSMSPELIESLQSYEQEGGAGDRIKAPGVDFYSITRTQGSMGCADSRSFVVQGGVAVPAQTPGESDDDDDGQCSTGVAFGKINDSSVAIIEDYNWRPGMTAGVDVWTWTGHGFEAACAVSLSYKPQFSRRTLNDWGETCSGNDCNALRDASFKLAESAEADAEALKVSSVERLNDAQRAQFQVMQQAFEARSREPSSNDAFSVPFLHDERLYIASVGHFAIGWRDFADWSVILETLEGGELKRAGAFAVGTWKGDLADVGVSAK